MALIGSGVLAIWNGIAAGAEAEAAQRRVHEQLLWLPNLPADDAPDGAGLRPAGSRPGVRAEVGPVVRGSAGGGGGRE
jgi:hypothetical protein